MGTGDVHATFELPSDTSGVNGPVVLAVDNTPATLTAAGTPTLDIQGGTPTITSTPTPTIVVVPGGDPTIEVTCP